MSAQLMTTPKKEENFLNKKLKREECDEEKLIGKSDLETDSESPDKFHSGVKSKKISIFEDDFESVETSSRGGINILLGSYFCQVPVVSMKNKKSKKLKNNKNNLIDTIIEKIDPEGKVEEKIKMKEQSERKREKKENVRNKLEDFKKWVNVNFYAKQGKKDEVKKPSGKNRK